MGIRLTPEQLKQLGRHVDLMLKWNRSINLTAITDPDEVAFAIRASLERHPSSARLFPARRETANQLRILESPPPVAGTGVHVITAPRRGGGPATNPESDHKMRPTRA